MRQPEMDYPEYADVEQPLLVSIHLRGNSVSPKDVYGPLADYFDLSKAERTITRDELKGDGRDESVWNNRVQWARRQLKKYGYLDPEGGHGIWKLSEKGVMHAKEVVDAKPQLLELSNRTSP